jgi:hypothetical protein
LHSYSPDFEAALTIVNSSKLFEYPYLPERCVLRIGCTRVSAEGPSQNPVRAGIDRDRRAIAHAIIPCGRGEQRALGAMEHHDDGPFPQILKRVVWSEVPPQHEIWCCGTGSWKGCHFSCLTHAKAVELTAAV